MVPVAPFIEKDATLAELPLVVTLLFESLSPPQLVKEIAANTAKLIKIVMALCKLFLSMLFILISPLFGKQHCFDDEVHKYLTPVGSFVLFENHTLIEIKVYPSKEKILVTIPSNETLIPEH
jgi:hypothetical protein